MVNVDYETMIANLENGVYEDSNFVILPLYPTNYVWNDKHTDEWNKRQVELVNEEITEINKKRSDINNSAEILFYSDLGNYLKGDGFGVEQIEILVSFAKETYALTFYDAFHNVENFIETHRKLNMLNS